MFDYRFSHRFPLETLSDAFSLVFMDTSAWRINRKRKTINGMLGSEFEAMLNSHSNIIMCRSGIKELKRGLEFIKCKERHSIAEILYARCPRSNPETWAERQIYSHVHKLAKLYAVIDDREQPPADKQVAYNILKSCVHSEFVAFASNDNKLRCLVDDMGNNNFDEIPIRFKPVATFRYRVRMNDYEFRGVGETPKYFLPSIQTEYAL